MMQSLPLAVNVIPDNQAHANTLFIAAESEESRYMAACLLEQGHTLKPG